MKHSGVYFAIMLTNSIPWLTTAIVSSVAISITENANWAFLLLIPALLGCRYTYERKVDTSNEKE